MTLYQSEQYVWYFYPDSLRDSRKYSAAAAAVGVA